MARQPSEIGKYRIERRLGQGGMGTVYLARDSRIGRHVALKLLRVDDDETRMRFEAEAQSAGRLKHPNIVTIYDYGDVEGFPFIVMEYVEGSTLASLIAQERLPIVRRLALIEQVCRGLAYAHRAGIVHRDIKPSNLMVDENGVIKLLDFGIARNAERGLTRTGRVLGTASYMSPEQVRGQPVDHRCDVFSVGVVLYEVLTGCRAFPGDSEYVVYDRILTGTPAPFEHADSRVTAAIQPILDRSLAKDPNDRYQDAESFASHLASVRELIEGFGKQTQIGSAGASAATSPTPHFTLADPSSPSGDAATRPSPAARQAPSASKAKPTPRPDRQEPVDAPTRRPVADPKPLIPPDDPSTHDAERAARIAAGMARARAHLTGGLWDAALRAGSEVLVDDPNYEPAHDIIQQALTKIQEQRRASGVRNVTAWETVEIARAIDPPKPRQASSSRVLPRDRRARPSWGLPVAAGLVVLVLAGSVYLFRARWTGTGEVQRGSGNGAAPTPMAPQQPKPEGSTGLPGGPEGATAPGASNVSSGPGEPPPLAESPIRPRPARPDRRGDPTTPEQPADPSPMPGRAEQLTLRLAAADRFSEDGEYDAAIAAYEEILREFPRSVRASQGLRDARRAKAAGESAPKPAPQQRPEEELGPRKQELLERIAAGQRRYDNGEYDEAIAEYAAALKISPGDETAQNGIKRALRAKAAEDGELKKRKPPGSPMAR